MKRGIPMRSKRLTILALALVLSCGPAVRPVEAGSMSGDDEADYNQVRTGVIQSIDPAHHMLVLDGGMRFVTWQAPDVEVDLSGLQPGTRINAYYIVRNGTNILTA